MGDEAPDRAEAERRAFAEEALTALVERAGAAAPELVRLRSRLTEPRAAGELARACDALERDGWLFGLFAREQGSDLLFERRDRRGLAQALALVRDMLAREGIVSVPPAVPALSVAHPAAVLVCASIARIAHAAGRQRVSWSLAREGADDVLHCAARPERELESALLDAVRRSPGSRLEVGTGRAAWRLPAGVCEAP